MSQFPPWLSSWLDDNDLLLGEDLDAAFEKAILAECSFLIVFISNDAANSDWVRKEVTLVIRRQQELSRVFVLPVLMNCDANHLIEMGLEGKKAVVILGEPAASDVAKQLVDQISAHCARSLLAYTSTDAERRS